MKTRFANTKQSTLSSIEIMHYFSLWVQNWKEKDFLEAFRNSPLGGRYFIDKLKTLSLSKLDTPTDISFTLILLILAMDEEHQNMLYDYIFNSRQFLTIIKGRENKLWFERAIKNQKKNIAHKQMYFAVLK